MAAGLDSRCTCGLSTLISGRSEQSAGSTDKRRPGSSASGLEVWAANGLKRSARRRSLEGLDDAFVGVSGHTGQYIH